VTVPLKSGREANPKLDIHGFTLASDKIGSNAANGRDGRWQDDECIRKEMYPAAEALAKRLMPGASAAFAFNHVRRQSRQSGQLSKAVRHTTSGVSAPSYMCHTDSTEHSWLAAPRLQQLVADGEFDAVGPTHLSADSGAVLAAAKRVVVLNLWRLLANFGEPSPTHLALCDMRSVCLTTDAIPYKFLVDGCVGHNYGLDAVRAAHHEWCYFPALDADEVIAFKAYDSAHPHHPPTARRRCNAAGEYDREGEGDAEGDCAASSAAWCFHAAVDDPTAPDDCPPRESVEVRVALAFE